MNRIKYIPTAKILILLLVGSLLVLGLSSCSALFPTDATLMITFDEGDKRSHFLPSISLEIESYRITLTRGISETRVVETPKASSVVLEALTVGQWSIAIEAFNGWDELSQSVAGEHIAYLAKNPQGNRDRTVMLSRGKVSELDATLVPRSDESGSLTLTVNWPSDSDILLGNPTLEIQVSSYNDYSSGYEESGTIFAPLVVTSADTPYTYTFTDVIPGWYKIRTTLTPQNSAGDAPRFWQGLDFAQVVPDDPVGTQGTITVTEAMFETGSTGGWTFTEQMSGPLDSLSVTHLADEMIFTGIDHHFSTTYTSDTAQYQWYVDGNPITDAQSPEFTYTFTTHGSHSVLVAVHDAGVINGAEMLVSVAPGYDIGQPGEAGGLIFYEDTQGLYLGWTYLEAAPNDLKVLTDGSPSCDSTAVGYDSATDTFIFGYNLNEPGGYNITLDTVKDIGSGASNTQILVDAMGSAAYTDTGDTETTDQYAARLCDILAYDGYDDWFLPSSYEVEQMFTNLYCSDGSGNFLSTGTYWSSSEYPTLGALVRMGDDTYHKTNRRGVYNHVRPVRAF
jgi:hypothetical protein